LKHPNQSALQAANLDGGSGIHQQSQDSQKRSAKSSSRHPLLNGCEATNIMTKERIKAITDKLEKAVEALSTDEK
jgi:hypothetical protein